MGICGHLREVYAQMVCLLLAHFAQKATLTETRSLIPEGYRVTAFRVALAPCSGPLSLSFSLSGLFYILLILLLHNLGLGKFLLWTELSSISFWLVSLSQVKRAGVIKTGLTHILPTARQASGSTRRTC